MTSHSSFARRVAAGNDATGGEPSSRRVVKPPCHAVWKRKVPSSVRMYMRMAILRAMFHAVNARRICSGCNTKMVSKRAQLLKYLMRRDRERYQELIGRLGLRK